MEKPINLFLFLGVLLLILSGCQEQKPGNNQPVRHILLSGEPNFRDFGGYETKDGKFVKWGTVYRSGKLTDFTDDDLKILDSLNIKTVVNFLTNAEIYQAGMDRMPENARSVHLPINAESDWIGILLEARKTGDFSEIPPEVNSEFHEMLVTEAKLQYGQLYREIIKNNGPLVFHCSHGVHRTGTAAAILLWYLGVPWEVVREDYLLSNECRADQIEKRIKQLQRLAASNQGIQPEEVDISNIEAFYVLKGFYIDAVKETIEQEYGSVEDYMSDGLGLNPGELEQLRKILLTDK